jgi:hypothetical protein
MRVPPPQQRAALAGAARPLSAETLGTDAPRAAASCRSSVGRPVLVTGANGRLGLALCQRLAEASPPRRCARSCARSARGARARAARARAARVAVVDYTRRASIAAHARAATRRSTWWAS